MNEMPVGNLTPPSNNTVVYRRYVGRFDQPDGFGSMLKARVNTDGRLELTIFNKKLNGNVESITIGLTNEQRLDLAENIRKFQPVKYEDITDDL